MPVGASRTTLLVLGCVLLVGLALAGNRLAKTGTASAPDVASQLDSAQIASGQVGSGSPAESGAPVAAASSKLVVHVVGAVRRPGLYSLQDGQRVADAVARAGGATRKADLAAINLAAPVVDGTQVLVPSRISGAGPGAPATPGSAGAVAPGGVALPGTKVSLSTATVEQLDALPGVGPVTAQKIVDYRTEHGPFASVDDLDAVSGIGPARIENLRELVTP
jgi:competence protein ComEA